jgi:DNA replication factor GINS
MNLEELRRVQRTERQTDSLQPLEDSFYRDAAAFIAERKAERDRAAEETDDPFSAPEVTRLTDEIETAEEVVESLYERRVGKVVKRATFAAADMSTGDDDGLTAEERDMFEDLVERIQANRRTVLDGLVGGEMMDSESGETPSPGVAPADASPPDAADATAGSETAPATDPTADAPAEQAPPDPDDLLAAAMGDEGDATDRPSPPDPATDGGGVDPDSEPGPGDDDTTDWTTLRITRDVGEIFGVDAREYDLGREDVVTLPTPNAEPLLDRGAAERLD